MIGVSMLTHEEIKKMLSAYCGGDLTSAERAWVDEHLSSCPSCRAELADLKTTLRLVRSTPAVDSPDWLTPRIMAHIIEQPVPKNGWLQRLFLPLHIKLPLEVLALLIISFTGYYLTQDSGSDLQKAVPQLQQNLKPTPPEAPAPAKEKAEAPPAPAAESAKTESYKNTAEKKQSEEITATPKSATTDKTTEHDANQSPMHDRSESNAAKMKKAAPARESQAPESFAPAPTSKGSAPSPAIEPTRIRISLIMGLDTLSVETVRQSVYRSGGTVLPAETTRSARQLTARIPAARLDELLAHLEKQARIVERPTVPESVETVIIDIQW